MSSLLRRFLHGVLGVPRRVPCVALLTNRDTGKPWDGPVEMTETGAGLGIVIKEPMMLTVKVGRKR